MKAIVTLICFLVITLPCYSQDGALEEYFFQSGKIKVVIAVAIVIAVGLFIYLWRLDKKISKLENK